MRWACRPPPLAGSSGSGAGCAARLPAAATGGLGCSPHCLLAPCAAWRRTTVAGLLNIMGVLFSSTLFMGARAARACTPLVRPWSARCSSRPAPRAPPPGISNCLTIQHLVAAQRTVFYRFAVEGAGGCRPGERLQSRSDLQHPRSPAYRPAPAASAQRACSGWPPLRWRSRLWRCRSCWCRRPSTPAVSATECQ